MYNNALPGPLLDIDLDGEIGVVVRGWFGITATESNAITLFTKLGSDCRTYVSAASRIKATSFVDDIVCLA